MCPYEGLGFGLLDEGVLAGDIGFKSDIRVGDEFHFDLGVFLCLGWVGDEVISEGEVPVQVGRALGKGVDVVGSGALGGGFAEVAAGFDAELTHDLVTEGLHARGRAVKSFKRSDFDQDVDNRFGEDIGD